MAFATNTRLAHRFLMRGPATGPSHFGARTANRPSSLRRRSAATSVRQHRLLRWHSAERYSWNNVNQTRFHIAEPGEARYASISAQSSTTARKHTICPATDRQRSAESEQHHRADRRERDDSFRWLPVVVGQQPRAVSCPQRIASLRRRTCDDLRYPSAGRCEAESGWLVGPDALVIRPRLTRSSSAVRFANVPDQSCGTLSAKPPTIPSRAGSLMTSNDNLRERSSVLVDGPNRAAARSQLYSVGYDDEALSKPLVMVAHSWIGTMPCNFSHRELAQDVMRGIARPAAPPGVNTVSISDDHMGTEAKKPHRSRDHMTDRALRRWLRLRRRLSSACDKPSPARPPCMAG